MDQSLAFGWAKVRGRLTLVNVVLETFPCNRRYSMSSELLTCHSIDLRTKND
jgi:hypothetical protein